MTSLTPGRLAHLRTVLQVRQSEMRRELDSEMHAPGDLDTPRIVHDVDEFNAIDEALQRLRAGSYGICTECGGAIGWPRLQALPQALCCIGCETAREHGHGILAAL